MNQSQFDELAYLANVAIGGILVLAGMIMGHIMTRPRKP